MKVIRSLILVMGLLGVLGSPAVQAQTKDESALWESIQNSKDADDYKAYLDKYPDGVYAPLARRRAARTATRVGDSAPAMDDSQQSAAATEPAMTPSGTGTRMSLTECEGTNNCGTWTFLGKRGSGEWGSGATASLTLEEQHSDAVIIHRADTTGATAGLIATYRGSRHGNRIAGEFTSSWPGHWQSQTGNWYATLGKVSVALPTVMHACIQCQTGMGGTLVWENDHYTNVASGAGILETYTVESFAPESVILHRHDHGAHEGEAILTGQISPEGNSIVNGMQHWVGNPDSYHSFRAAWGSAIGSVPGARRPDPVVVAVPVVCFPWFFGIVCN